MRWLRHNLERKDVYTYYSSEMSNGHLKTDNDLSNIDQEEVKLKEKSASEEGKEKEKRRRERKDQRDKEKRSSESQDAVRQVKESLARTISPVRIVSSPLERVSSVVKQGDETKSPESVDSLEELQDQHFMKSSKPPPKNKDDQPKIDAGVRMLCMDGGGAKGAIEATIIDKIFVTVAVTLKYPDHIVNWLTLFTEKSVKIEDIKAKIVDIVDEEKFKNVEIIVGNNLLERKCYIIAGMINQEELSTWLTVGQKKGILDAYNAEPWEDCQLKDFLHGTTKYWVRFPCNTDEERTSLKNRIGKVFSNNKKTKPHSFLIPSFHVTGKHNEDLLVFYWDKPTKTKYCNRVRDDLLSLGAGEVTGQLFIDEVQAHELFDLLIGTSTGSILAFGMGYLGLSPQQCRDIYLKSIKDIFSARYDNSSTGAFLNGTILRTVGDLLGQGHYDIAGVVDTLSNHFKGMKMGGGSLRKQCVCACVALNWETQASETFDTHDKKISEWDLIPFLAASSDAPVYFNTPYLIKGPNEEKGTNYVDGGLGANCPAKKGIELAKERWPDKDIELVLAIGAGKAPNIDLPDNGGAWLKTFVSFATDGDKVWENQVLPTLATDDRCEHAAHHRIQPIIAKISTFAADDIRVQEMCVCAEDWLNTSTAVDHILEAAGKIISKSISIDVESRILTEADLLRWVASESPFMKGQNKKDPNYYTTGGMGAQTISSDMLDMKFGREIHCVKVNASEKLRDRTPTILNRYTYHQKQQSVSNSDMLFTVRFDHSVKVGNLRDKKILNLHCPDNHEAKLVGYLQLFDYTSVYPLSCITTVPDADSTLFHRVVHEASKEISQLKKESLKNAEDSLCKAFKLTTEEKDKIYKMYPSDFLRIQSLFYLWKNKNPSANLTSLNRNLIEVGMKKRSWPVANAPVGKTDVTIRTILPASSQTILFEVSLDYFTSKLQEANAEGNEEGIKRYGDFMRLLKNNPLSKQNKKAKFQNKTISNLFNRKTKIGRTGEAHKGMMEKWKKQPPAKKKVTKEGQKKGASPARGKVEPERSTTIDPLIPSVMRTPSGPQQGTVQELDSANPSLLDRTRTRIFKTKTKKVHINVPEKYQNSPYNQGLDVVVEVPSRDPSASPQRGRRRVGAFC